MSGRASPATQPERLKAEDLQLIEDRIEALETEKKSSWFFKDRKQAKIDAYTAVKDFKVSVPDAITGVKANNPLAFKGFLSGGLFSGMNRTEKDFKTLEEKYKAAAPTLGSNGE